MPSIAILAAALPTVLLVHILQYGTAFSPPGELQPMMHPPHCHQLMGHRRAASKTSLFSSSSDIQAKLKAQMAKLQDRDRSSREVSPDVSKRRIYQQQRIISSTTRFA